MMTKHNIIPEIAATEEEMIALRRHIHAHPELAFQEVATGNLVAQSLEKWGFTVHRGLGKTGVVGSLRKGSSDKKIGLRADMDALPITEATQLPYASKHEGVMHACGHDGHTAMLLSTARYLAEHGQFDGTVNMIFQPAEEGLCGARAMIEDGLFEKFPCDAVFGMHNSPGMPVGQFGFLSGPMMASADTVIITIQGKGGHGAFPHNTVDPVVIASSIVMSLQSVVSRNVDPQKTAIVTVGAILAGTVSNVIPNSCELRLSVRSLDAEVRNQLQDRITELVHAQAASFGGSAHIDYDRCYPVLINHHAETILAEQVVKDWLGEAALAPNMAPITASEDFAYMLEARPGTHCLIGNGDGESGCQVHNPGYDFNDRILTLGASYWANLTTTYLKK